MTRVIQSMPASEDGVFWTVFEHLAEAELSDSSVMDAMTPEQQQVLAIGMLRREVNAGGFDSYSSLS